MAKLGHERDQERFDKLKETQVERGRDPQKATEIAAEETKEMREREGRAKPDDEEVVRKPSQTPPKKYIDDVESRSKKGKG